MVDDRGHRLRSGSPVTNLPGASTTLHFKQDNIIDVFVYSRKYISALIFNICWWTQDVPEFGHELGGS